MIQKQAVTEAAGQHRCPQIIQALQGAGFELHCLLQGHQPLRTAVVDSREAGPEILFIARRGNQTDGHNYIDAAYENGCRYFLVSYDYLATANAANRLPSDASFIGVKGSTEQALYAWARAYRRSLKQLYVLAISGSYGKTSTKELLGCVLAQRYRCYITAGNRNAPVGCALTILGIAPEMELAVLELGIDHPGEMDLLCSLAQPNAALLTGIGSAHLEGFGTREKLASEKARIYAYLHQPPNTKPNAKANKALTQALALLPADDYFLPLLRAEINRNISPTSVCQIMYSAKLAQQQGYRVEDRGLQGLRFHFCGSTRDSLVEPQKSVTKLSCDIPILGLHTQQVFWAAASAAQNLGLNPTQIFIGAQHYCPLFGRGQLQQVQLKDSGIPFTMLEDCYNASPESMYALIKMLHSWEQQGLLPPCVLVLADMLELGEASVACHRKIAHQLSCFWQNSKVQPQILVLFYGKEMQVAHSELPPMPMDCIYVQNQEQLTTTMYHAIEHIANKAQPLLVTKGARGMHLEKIVEKILL